MEQQMQGRFVIEDYVDSGVEAVAKKDPEPMPLSFGRDLRTTERAREWLSNPHNWFESELFILKWDGIVPYISRRAATRMVEHTWDDGLPWCAVYGQEKRRSSKREEIEKEDPSEHSGEEPA